MAGLSETSEVTSRYYAVLPGLIIPNVSETLKSCWRHSSVLDLEKYSKNLNFNIATRAPISRKNVAEQGIEMSNWSKTFQTFWSHFSIFPLYKQPKILNFQGFFTSRRLLSVYFQWNACNYLQKLFSSTRYSDVKLIKNISIFLVALLHFCLRETT